jgi:secondary thiamine-phosphate synthase enzyme
MRAFETMAHASATLWVETTGVGFYRIGRDLGRSLKEMQAENGVLCVFLAHTSASLCIQENADPDVLGDLRETLDRLAPENLPYRHRSEGPDDMPAHIKTLFTATSLTLPVRNGTLALGTWQEVYVIEHRRAGHRRRLELDFIGTVRAQAATEGKKR